MGRPRKTSGSVASPQPAATAPKATPAALPSSVSSRTGTRTGTAAAAPATKGEGSRGSGPEKVACATKPRGARQSSQPKAAAEYGGKPAEARSSRGPMAKGSVASGRAKPPAGSFQDAIVTQDKPRYLPAPLPAAKIAEVEKSTRGQRTNPEWHQWREKRITASIAPKIAHSKFANGRTSEVPQSYLKEVVESGSKVQTPAISWGIRNEKAAVEAYEALKSSRTSKAVKVDDCGLFIDKKKEWLAASPDGIVREAATGKELGVLEVKCPYKHRNKTVTEACKDKTFCLEKEGNTYSLKKSHPYYTQVQCQMGVTGLKNADFVVHTKKETVIAPVDFDPEFWKETVPKLEKFYTDAVVPYVEEKRSSAWAKEE